MERYLTLEGFISYCAGKRKIGLSAEEIEHIKEVRRAFESLMATDKIYGVNTGVGKLVEKSVSLEDQEKFQENLIMSHAAGVGRCISLEESRGVLLLLINMLRKGKSAASEGLLLKLAELFNQDLIPAIPEKGSVGASGDLAPLAHLALVLLGKGNFFMKGRLISSSYTLVPLPLRLKAGEALALINGTHFMTSLLAHSIHHAHILSQTADICAAMTFKALGGRVGAFDNQLQRLRSHPGALVTAGILRRLLVGEDCPGKLLQDPYCLRCVPQVHGVVKEEAEGARIVIEREMNSVTCNPIIENGRALHGGNFHGQPLAQVADSLSVAISALANISERRINKLFMSPDLPAFLVEESGLNSGLMIAQYTAASLVSENKTLAHPASVDSIPVAAGQEDFVSMGGWAVRKLKEICRNTGYVLAIELLCAAQALDFCNLNSDSKIAKIHRVVRGRISHLKEDRILAWDIEAMFNFVYSGEFLENAKKIMKK